MSDEKVYFTGGLNSIIDIRQLSSHFRNVILSPGTTCEGVSLGVELQSPSESQCCHDLWGGYKGVRLWVGVVAPSEVSVVAGDDGVLLPFLNVLSVPLTDARATGIGQHHSSYLLKWLVLERRKEVDEYSTHGAVSTLLN